MLQQTGVDERVRVAWLVILRALPSAHPIHSAVSSSSPLRDRVILLLQLLAAVDMLVCLSLGSRRLVPWHLRGATAR